MGKTSKPLTIVALPPVSDWEELVELEAKGYTIIRVEDTATQIDDLPGIDIILGPNCWRMTPAHRKYLNLAIKEARMLRYQEAAKRADKKTRDENEIDE